MSGRHEIKWSPRVSQTPGTSQLISLVSMVAEQAAETGCIRRTFKILPHPPQGNSYARETAARYGIEFQQLSALIHEQAQLNPVTS